MPASAAFEPACFGMACPRRDGCARYAAVDDSAADPGTIATCTDGRAYPLYLRFTPARATPHGRAGLPAVA